MFEKYNCISFASNDYDLMVLIKSALKSEHKIGKNGDNGFQLSICNKILYNDLLELGGTPRKSLTIQFPEIPDEFLSHFIRGEFDGDGCFYIFRNGKYKYLNSTFTGNVDFLSVLKNKIKEHTNIDAANLSSIKKCNPKIKKLEYNGKKAIALGDYIYKDSKNLRLERKYEIYNKMKKFKILKRNNID